MAEALMEWSNHRKTIANGVAAVLYGVVAIMSAEIGLQPGSLTPIEGATGALLVGLAMALTRLFVEVVKRETELGSHVGLTAGRDLVGMSFLVMVFPGFVALLATLSPSLGFRVGTLANAVPFISIAVVFALGFGSSYVLERQTKLAAIRGLCWTFLCLVLFAAKEFV